MRKFLLLLLFFAVSPVLADASSGLSLDESVSLVRDRFHGRVLSAETSQTPEGRVHGIRVMLPNGVIKRVRINARTGRQMGRSTGR